MVVDDLNGQYIWFEHLIWCPSQCYYYFRDTDGTRYCIYLRWRHRDPWTAELIRCTKDWGFDDHFDWEKLDIKFHTDEDYRSLEKEVVELISSRFPNLVFPEDLIFITSDIT